MMVQRYAFLHKINGNENIFVLNFAKSNNLKVLCSLIFVSLHINQNIKIMKIKIPFKDRSQMTMKKKIATPFVS